MCASMATAVLFIFLAISGCGTLDHKTILLNVGDSKKASLRSGGRLKTDRSAGSKKPGNTASPAQDLVGMTIRLFG